MKAVIQLEKDDGMFPFSETRPTATIDIAGKNLIEQTIDALHENEIDDIVVETDYMPKSFEEMSVEVMEDAKVSDEEVILIDGNFLISAESISRLKEEQNALLDLSRGAKFEDGEVVEAENPSGVYKFSGLESTVEDTLEELSVKKVETEGVNVLIDSGEKIWKANQMMREMLEPEISEEAEVSEDANILGEIVVERGARVEAGVTLKGQCFIGEDVLIESGSVVKNSTIGKGSQLDNCSVENSVLFENCALDAFTALERCVIGEGCDFKSGSVLRESLIGAESFVEANNTVLGTKFVPNARTDIGEISK